MNNVDIQNGWEFYRAYQSVSRHVLSKNNHWKYDLFRQGFWENINQQKFMNNSSTIELWSDLSAEVLEIHPSMNRMGVVRAFAMTFFNNNNKFYCNKNSASDIIANYTEYKSLLRNSKKQFITDIVALSKDYKKRNLSIKEGLTYIEKDNVADIMYQFYQERISLTSLYILNNLFRASNPNKLSLMTYLQNVNSEDIFLKLFSRNIDMWEYMFEFDYSEISKIYLMVRLLRLT